MYIQPTLGAQLQLVGHDPYAAPPSRRQKSGKFRAVPNTPQCFTPIAASPLRQPTFTAPSDRLTQSASSTRRRSSTPFPQISLPPAAQAPAPAPASPRRRRSSAVASVRQQLRDAFSDADGVLDFVRGAGVFGAEPGHPSLSREEFRRAVHERLPNVRPEEVDDFFDAVVCVRDKGGHDGPYDGALTTTDLRRALRLSVAEQRRRRSSAVADRRGAAATRVQARHRGRAARRRAGPLRASAEIERLALTTPAAARTFAALDPSRTGLIDKQALLLHLLAAGDDPDAVSLLFSALGAKDGATVSASEWAEGVARYNGVGYRDAQVRCGVCRAASGRFKV